MRRWHPPVFTALWLVAAAAIYTAVIEDDGFARGPVTSTFLVPDAIVREPWRILLAPVAYLVSHDAVQFAYVVALFAAAVPALEAREGWRRAALAYVGAGLASALAVLLLVLVPLALLAPDNPVVAFSASRVYSGSSTGAFAAVGALAASLGGRSRAVIVGAAVAWEAFIAVWYYGLAELIPAFHFVALASGVLVTRTPLWRRLAPAD